MRLGRIGRRSGKGGVILEKDWEHAGYVYMYTGLWHRSSLDASVINAVLGICLMWNVY